MGAGNIFFGSLVVAGIVLIGADLHRPASSPAPEAGVDTQTEPVAEVTKLSGHGGITLPRAADNHFYADALVNGTPVRFLIDTGASSVVLTQADAQRAGLGAGDYKARAIGAGGEVRLRPVRLTRLALGSLAADSVDAMVAEPGSLPVSLLGQSFLGRFDSVTIKGDRLVLR